MKWKVVFITWVDRAHQSIGHEVPGVVVCPLPKSWTSGLAAVLRDLSWPFRGSHRRLSYAFGRSRWAASFAIQPSGCKEGWSVDTVHESSYHRKDPTIRALALRSLWPRRAGARNVGPHEQKLFAVLIRNSSTHLIKTKFPLANSPKVTYLGYLEVTTSLIPCHVYFLIFG